MSGRLELRSVFLPEMMRDEELLWTGRPDPNALLTRADIFLIPFSILWGGFAIFWEIGVIASGAPWFFAIWGIPFVLVGLYLIAGRFLYKRWRKGRTYYALTDRRVLVLTEGLRGRTLRAAFIDTIPAINHSIGRDGRGSITFGNPSYASAFGNTGWDFFGGFYGAEVPTFYDVNGASQVVELVNSLKRR